MPENKESTEKAIVWKTIERAGYLGCQFIFQLIMARLLDPDDYGALSVMIIFINFANVFVQTGLTSAVVQAKNIDDNDCSSVFWINMLFSLFFGVILFFSAPCIEEFYCFDNFVLPFRVLLLILPLSANTAVQTAILSREMTFQPIMRASLISIFASGMVGILLSLNGFGVMALVSQQIVYYFANSILLSTFSKWHPKLFCSLYKIKLLILYGWKILASNIVEVIYNEAVSFTVGKKFSPTILAYYNRGKQYPQMLVSIVKESLQSVLLSSFSRDQDNRVKISSTIRMFVRISSTAVYFLTATLAATSRPLVVLMLTEKWLPCVPFLKLACIYFALVPISTVTLQAVNAVGRSDVYLRLSIIKRLISLGLVVASVFLFDSIIYIAIVWTFTGVLNIALNYKDIKKLFNYTLKELFIDTIPYIGIAIITYIVQTAISFIISSDLIIVMVQCIIGIGLYWLLLRLFRLRGYFEFVDFFKAVFISRKNPKRKV